MEDRALKILIVEDDAVDRQMLRRTLSETDLSVSIEEVDSSKGAIDLLNEKRFDIALLDYKLLDGTAISILKALQDKKSAQTPIIVLTAHAQKTIALEALKEGAQDFLPKDMINADNLERAIRYAIQRNELFQELQWSRERERRERELRAFQESLSEFETVQPPPLQELAYTFEPLVEEYQRALEQAVEEQSFRVPQEVPDRMRLLAAKLGDLHAGPKDVVQIHTTALKHASAKSSKQRDDALTTEARILVVQLMGYLCGYYRNCVFGLSAQSKRDKKKQG